ASQLSATLNAVPDIILCLDRELNYAQIHTARPELLFRPIEELINRNIFDIVPSELHEKLRQAIDEAQRHQYSSQIEYPRTLPDGTHWFEMCASVYGETDDSFDGYVISIRDISAKRQALEALRYSQDVLRMLFEQAPIALVLSDFESRRLLEANPAFLAMSGLTAENIGDYHTYDVISSGTQVSVNQLRHLVEINGRVGPAELRVRHVDGTSIPVQVRAVAITDDQQRKLVWNLLVDLRERDRLDQMKNEFVSVVSHELRTPLTAISGAMDLLAHGALNTGAHDRLVRIARSNCTQLRSLIDDLLDMDRLQTGRMPFDFLDLPMQPLIEAAVESVSTCNAEPDRFELHCECDSPVQCRVDPNRFTQALTNLLSNAMKFSPPDSRILVTCRVDGERLRIDVRDRGPGVPQSFQPHLFEKFSQADGTDSR
ncbi:MAG: PAS domain-containing sensor histidine kinase, partial [Xanthomonadales bacterium]|nr:PAS domain-containing sensor histidine kinase [Xanthomonadales bacterium]